MHRTVKSIWWPSRLSMFRMFRMFSFDSSPRTSWSQWSWINRSTCRFREAIRRRKDRKYLKNEPKIVANHMRFTIEPVLMKLLVLKLLVLPNRPVFYQTDQSSTKPSSLLPVLLASQQEEQRMDPID